MTNKVTFSVKKIDAANLAGKSRIVAIIIIYAISANAVAFADSSSWWNADWPQAQVINVSTPNNLTDYQINIMYNSTNVGAHWNWSNNGNDLRYTGFFSNGTEDTSKTIPYWIESWNSTSNTASIWVKANITNVSTINEGYGQIKAYYGNPSAISTSNGNATWVIFLDNTTVFDTSKFSTYTAGSGSITARNTIDMYYIREQGHAVDIFSKNNISVPAKIISALKHTRVIGGQDEAGLVVALSDLNNVGCQNNLEWDWNGHHTAGLRYYGNTGATYIFAKNSNDNIYGTNATSLLVSGDTRANFLKKIVTVTVTPPNISVWNDSNLFEGNISTNLPTQTANSFPLVVSNKGFCNGNAGSSQFTSNITYVVVGTYSSPEPAYSLGAEQHSDTTPPSLASYAPSTDTVGIDTNTAIDLVFSEGMNQTTFSGIALKDSSNNSVSIFLESYNGATYRAVFRPSGALESNKKYTATLTGLTDLAGNILPNTSWAFTTITYYNITLSKSGANGWNLVSLPVVPTNTSIESVISNVKSDIESIWAYNSITGNWSMYAPNNPSSELTQMTAGYGYWINYNNSVSKAITGSGNLIIEGANTPPQRTLVSGWNLIGYYQRENTNAIASKCALFTLTPNINDETAKWWSMVFGYDNQNKQPTQTGYASNMSPGQGYWIFMTSKLNTYAYGPGLSSSECA